MGGGWPLPLAMRVARPPQGAQGVAEPTLVGLVVVSATPLPLQSDYCVGSFLAKSVGIQTIVLVITDVGVVELDLVNFILFYFKKKFLIICFFFFNFLIYIK